MLLTRMQESASRYPDKVAVQIKTGDRYQQHTYRDLVRGVASVARSLSEHGINKGDRIALLSENRPEWMITYLAVVAYRCGHRAAGCPAYGQGGRAPAGELRGKGGLCIRRGAVKSCPKTAHSSSSPSIPATACHSMIWLRHITMPRSLLRRRQATWPRFCIPRARRAIPKG